MTIKNNDFITEFLSGEKPEGVDWVATNKYTRQLKYPPKINTDLLKEYSEVLPEIIQEKLQIALTSQEILKRQRKKRLQLILDCVALEHQWFFLEFEAEIFKEYHLISKWIVYWLNLWDEISGNSKPTITYLNQVSDLDIQKAKDHPIEKLYEGTLKKFGNRLNGLCPFHKERHPSFFIFENNCWHCFGACSEGGDAINFAMKSRKIGFVKAVKLLAYGT